MILIPEQIITIRQKIDMFNQEQKEYLDYLQEGIKTNILEESKVGARDAFVETRYNATKDDCLKAYDLLLNSEYLKERTTDKIDIGTKFIVEFADGEKETYTLVEDMFGLSSLDNYISIKSNLGQALRGKREQEEFIYTVGSNSAEIKGKILEIKKDKKDYINFIKSKDINCRYCRQAKKYNKIKPEAEKIKLTVSQLNLLKIEYERLAKQPKNKRTQKTIQRLAYIRKILSTVEIASPSPDHISIGSSFTILLNEDGNLVQKNLELINYALSDEIETEYVEKISTLGMTLYGLQEKENFVLHRFNAPDINGMVVKINKSKLRENKKVYVRR